MNILKCKVVPIAVAFALGSGQALADSGWYYDEDRDTIVFNVEGSRSDLERSSQLLEDYVGPQSRSWYYDEVRDTIVYNIEGSRSGYTRSTPSGDENVLPSQSWYYDYDRDTIVFNAEGSRSEHGQTQRAM
jgi:hypothetical protein